MRIRAVLTLLAGSVALLAWVGSAGAAFHLMHVNEVMVLGNSDAQFVELADPSDEAFPDANAPYKLVVYDAGGTKTGDQQLSVQTLRDKGTTPILISNATADQSYGVTGDIALTVKLPEIGRVCFTTGESESRVHCAAWGCGPATSVAPTPPAGQSIQRQPDEKWHTWSVTPGKANATEGQTSAPCPPAGGGGGGGGEPPADTRKPRVTVVLPTARTLGTFIKKGLKFGLTGDERGGGTVSAYIPAATAKRLRIARLVALERPADTPATVRLKPSRRIGRKLAKLSSVKLTLYFAVTDAAGNTGQVVRRLTLRA